MTIYCLQIGQRVKLANGMIAEITDIDTKTEYLYPLTGEVSIDGVFKQQMSWTKTGHYYTSEHPSPRDIEEVVSGQRVEITRAHGVHDYLGAGENTNSILLYGSQTN